MIRAFSTTDKVYKTNGDAVIAATKARVKNEDNGDFILELVCSSEYNDYIQANNIIVAPTPQGDQAFRVRQVEKRGNRIEAKCYHVFYDAENYIIADSYAYNMTAKQALEHFNTATDNTSPFTVDSDITSINNLRIVRGSLAEAVISVIERWGGHLYRDNFNVSVKSILGTDNGITIEYKKNLKELTASYDWSGVITKLLPVGKDGILIDGLYVSSATQYDIPFTKTVSFEQEIEREDYASDEAYIAALKADLRAQAQRYVNLACVPNINYTLKGNPEKVTDIGDVIEVKDARIGVNVLTKVIAYEYDAIANKYVSLEFGNFTPKLSSLMGDIKSETASQIASATSNINIEVNAIENAVTILNSSINQLENGKQNKLTAGENIVINNDIISAKGINVLYGTDAPEDTSGNNKDFYLELNGTNNSVLIENDYTTDATATHPISVTSFTRKSATTYDFDITGNPSNGSGEKLYYNLHGLIAGNTYTINFKGKYSDGTTFPYYPQYDAIFAIIVDGVQTSVVMPSDTLIHNNTITFTAGTDNKIFYYLSSRDDVVTTLSITDWEVIGASFGFDIKEIYNKHENTWRKYTPPASASALSELTDVELTNLTDKDIIEWDEIAEKWKNKPNSGGGGNSIIINGHVYSTTEKQVGVWVDGKPLYEIAIPLSNMTSTPFYIDTSSYNIDLLLSLDGYVKHKNVYVYMPLLRYESSSYNVSSEFDSDTQKIRLNISSGNQTWYNDGYAIIQYTKKSDHAGSGGYQAYGFSPIIYSEEEREVGVWIDNKPLYAKSFKQQLSGSSAHIDVTSLNIADGWVYDGFYDIGVTNLGLNENLASNSYTWTHLNNELNPPYIDCFCAGFNNSTVYVTILYTKTTDVAGSGSYNTLGVPTVAYTYDEQVIGTYLGKPLYRRVFDVDYTFYAPANDNWQDTPIQITNLENIVDCRMFRLAGGGDYVENKNILEFGRSANSYIQYCRIISGVNNGITIKRTIVEYTKTTD